MPLSEADPALQVRGWGNLVRDLKPPNNLQSTAICLAEWIDCRFPFPTIHTIIPPSSSLGTFHASKQRPRN
jgi:hypothetical protein